MNSQNEWVSICIGNQVLPVAVDRIIEESDYFKALFNSGMKEAQSRKVNLPEFNYDIVRDVINFIENGIIVFHLSSAEDLLQVASYLQMTKLLKEIEKNLLCSLTVDNCTIIKQLAKNFYLSNVETGVKHFLQDNFFSYASTEEFVKLDSQQVCELLQQDEILIENEYLVFEAAIKWISNSNPSSDIRKQILSTVRFPLMSGNKVLECEDVLKAMNLYSDCEDFINNARLYHESPYLIDKHNLRAVKARRLRPALICLGGFTSKEHSTCRLLACTIDDIESEVDEVILRNIEKKNNGARRCVRLPTALCEHCTITAEPFLYVAGGQTTYCQDGRYTRNNVYRLDSRDLTWLELCPMLKPRSLFYLGAIDDKLYAVGGWTAPDTVTHSVECYNPADNIWIKVASLPIGLHEHAGCIQQNKMYISGGYKGPYRGHLDKHFSYDSSTDQWSELAPMRHARSYHTMVPYAEHGLLILGGVNYLPEGDCFEDVKLCELYSCSANQWTTVCSVPSFTSCAPHFLHKESLYLFGGHSFQQDVHHRDLQILCLETFTWQKMTFSSNNISYFTCDLVYVPESVLKLSKSK